MCFAYGGTQHGHLWSPVTSAPVTFAPVTFAPTDLFVEEVLPLPEAAEEVLVGIVAEPLLLGHSKVVDERHEDV